MSASLFSRPQAPARRCTFGPPFTPGDDARILHKKPIGFSFARCPAIEMGVLPAPQTLECPNGPRYDTPTMSTNLPSLIAALQSDTIATRVEAAEKLCHLGETARPMAVPLVRTCADESDEVREEPGNRRRPTNGPRAIHGDRGGVEGGVRGGGAG